MMHDNGAPQVPRMLFSLKVMVGARSWGGGMKDTNQGLKGLAAAQYSGLSQGDSCGRGSSCVL